MTEPNSIKFFTDLLSASGPSGYEEANAAVFRDYLKSFCHQVETDVMGNTIGILNPDAEFKVMLAGHYDEIGFQIVYINDDGMLYFRANGGIDKLNVPGSEVEILAAKGKVNGVIGKIPPHLLTPKQRETPPELCDLWIDIGAESREEAEALVAVGDPVAMRPNVTFLGNNRIMSKGMDDKVGAFIVAETLRELSKRDLNVGVYGVGTVQEEVGSRGAITSAYKINPDMAIIMDVGFATDMPDIPKKKWGDIQLGKGPVLNTNADNNPVLRKLLQATAEKHKIPFQQNTWFQASGGSDTADIQLTRAGIATALISIPNRYMHSPVEICDLRDADNCIRILTETIANLSGRESFIPGID